MFETVPACAASVVSTSVGRLAPTFSPAALAWSQTSVCVLPEVPATEHDQPLPDAETKLSPLSCSITRSVPVARRGPPLVTTMVEVRFEPRATGLGVLVLARRRSAPSGSTSTPAEPVLLPGAGSAVLLAMVAVLV